MHLSVVKGVIARPAETRRVGNTPAYDAEQWQYAHRFDGGFPSLMCGNVKCRPPCDVLASIHRRPLCHEEFLSELQTLGV